MAISSPPTSVAVLDSAVTWTHTCLHLARGSSLDATTPCRGWDLGALLVHMDESLAAIGEAAELGHVAVEEAEPPVDTAQLVDRLVQRACHLRTAWRQRVTSAPVGVGDLTLGRDTVALVGALEIAVHGWDVAWASGKHTSLPEDLAARLYDVALAVVTPPERAHRFGPALTVPPTATIGTRLLAHLGRPQP